jgi:CdiI N-terminal domain
MFGIRVFTPALASDAGLPEAGAELRVGRARLPFRIDLRRWGVANYERQWKEGLKRIAGGASSSALMWRYSPPGDTPHQLWALWRVGDAVFVQSQSIVRDELEVAFDPASPYAQVGERVPTTEAGLPICEWRAPVSDVIAAAFSVRWPFAR